jgi:hypothetical protein
MMMPGGVPPEVAEAPVMAVVDEETIKRFNKYLNEYKAGKTQTENRIIASENWWKLRNSTEERKTTGIGADDGFKAVSGWLHNVIVSKHADAMEAFPEPNILPREEGDRGEARMLSSIIPCVLEQNNFEATYSDAMWQKLKTGTGCYKVVWDKNKLNGLGDISIERVNLLNIYWEPGVTDIQRSRYLFHTELWDKDVLEERYPELKGKLNGQSFLSSKFQTDDTVNTADKYTVVDVYYKKRGVLHYAKYVGDQLLFATENDPEMAQTGIYDHGKYPYFFDALYPIEGSPCGYGYIDLCKNPQTEIDLLKTAMVKNAMVSSTPRYFSRQDGNVNEAEFLDLSKPIVHTAGMVDEASLRVIDTPSLPGSAINLLEMGIHELRETSGNTETSTGSTSAGVTAASAIAALQAASGKGSADSTRSSYRVYSDMVEMCIELVRQFYDLPRKFRILGQYGAEQYVTYSNAGIRPQVQAGVQGVDVGMRTPLFDVKVSAQKKNVYTKVTQNELALQFYQLGFFDPARVDQTMMCLEIMDFDGKDGILQKVSQMGNMYQQLQQYMQLALALANESHPEMVPGLQQDMMMTTGATPAMPMGGTPAKLTQADNIAGLQKKEPTIVANARQRASEASQPNENKAVARREG